MVHRMIPSILGNQKFMTHEELYDKVRKYHDNKIIYADELARTYGWPIGKWDVSLLTDFTKMFCQLQNFNEDISDWDMTNVTYLDRMFQQAYLFNQDLSKWNTSQV
eukprot:CAMPEP_0178938026 /NCGR_PEP_ID=MMETSP0786-20121207/26102_1 /TAXON_ID=186022 /ORGANISM="Thalassionema frauenfeldii, Strain CCMP 1798" /LENGTH=105 /DNA_ID=CAMNT_0020616699 /DNA_START=454 /DNA_END=767 /DNA_ORIENTATION=-